MEKLSDNQIGKILLDGGYIEEEDLSRAKKYSESHHSSLVDYFLSEEILNRDILGQAVAEFFRKPYADLNTHPPLREQVLKIPEDVAKKYHIVLFKEEGDKMIFSTDNPANLGIESNLRVIFPGKNISLAYSFPGDIDALFVHYQEDLNERLESAIKNNEDFAPIIIGELINNAIINKASDIHFGVFKDDVKIRFRVDGLLREVGSISKIHYQNILNKIKIDSNLRIDDHFIAQDGSMRFEHRGLVVDMRISIVPSRHGEKIVIRILSQYVSSLNLSDLGVSQRDRKIIFQEAEAPFGMILVVGPTGSGKTTTLYAVLKSINHPDINITTIEDPIEYEIIGATQIQVNAQAKLTFSKGLRSIVRQDPDVILVGEIRDKETAEISINAALTGHLLFSTFHANNAAATIPRLLDIGIEPFLLSSTLNLIVAQRLVRKICNSCRYSYSQNVYELRKIIPDVEKYFSGSEVTLYKGEGCAVCAGTGYSGRSAVMELIKITPEIKELIMKNPSSGELWKMAKKQGSLSLFEDGVGKVKEGITTIEELLRVAPKE